MTTKHCEDCGEIIPVERLEVLPNTKYCVKCSISHPLPDPDPNILCARASLSSQNGFSPKD
jgi:hypothetical protein